MSNFQKLEAVGRGSDTQLQVDENFKKITYSRIRVNITIAVFGGSCVNLSTTIGNLLTKGKFHQMTLVGLKCYKTGFKLTYCQIKRTI